MDVPSRAHGPGEPGRTAPPRGRRGRHGRRRPRRGPASVVLFAALAGALTAVLLVWATGWQAGG
ncbi:hypothetical protein AB0J52_37740, partial [Spirillospora sp. NPDC049652]